MEKNSNWKGRFQEIVQVCQDELKKTTSIGRKMINASKTNTCMKEAFEELGVLAFDALEDKKIDWDNNKAQRLIKTINELKDELEEIETQVKSVKAQEQNTNNSSEN